MERREQSDGPRLRFLGLFFILCSISDMYVINDTSVTLSRHQTQIYCRVASETPIIQRCTGQLTQRISVLYSLSMPVQAADAHAEQQPAGDTPLSSPAGPLQKPQPSSSSKAQKRKLTDAAAAYPPVDASAAAKRRAAVTAAELPANGTPTAAGVLAAATAAVVSNGQDAELLLSEVKAAQSQSGNGSESSEEAESDASDEESSDVGSDGVSVPPPSHPYGVQPWGNYYLSQVPEIRTAGACVCLCVSTYSIHG